MIFFFAATFLAFLAGARFAAALTLFLAFLAGFFAAFLAGFLDFLAATFVFLAAFFVFFLFTAMSITPCFQRENAAALKPRRCLIGNSSEQRAHRGYDRGFRC